MQSSYKRIGDIIHRVNAKNTDGEYDLLLGINIDKHFMPSVANIVGTDLAKYKVVRYNQFACNRMHVGRDKRIPLALSQNFDPFIVSPAYTVFEITDTSELYPEYLMMWFSRPEFDREAWFHTDADVRGGLSWDLFCDIELPVPSIEKQREIVKEYNTIVNRIKLNEQLNQKLEETAQALYKHWFVDFEFPNKNGQPYKSFGGVMVYNEELDQEIPEGWKSNLLGDLCTKITKGTTPKVMSEHKNIDTSITYIKGESINENHRFDIDKLSYISENTHQELLRSQIEENDICYSIAGSLDKFTIVDMEILPANTNQAIAIIRVDTQKITFQYLYGFFISQMQKEFYNYNVQQAVQANLSLTTISSLPVIIPDYTILKKISSFMDIWLNNRNSIVYQNRRLEILKELVLAKMSKVEFPKTEQVA